MLPSQCALRVRLVAPLEARAKYIAGQEGLSPLEARIKVKQVDAKRAAFVWRVFKKDVGSPLNHDLILNTGDLSIESATKIVLVALEEKLGVPARKQPGLLKELHERVAA